MDLEFLINKTSILLIILSFLALVTSYKQHSLKPSIPLNESKYNQRQDKGPVYHPLREKPFSRKTMKV